MDGSHAALAAGGLVLGWWFSGPQAVRPEPQICQCHCSSTPERSSGESSWAWAVILLCFVLLGANLVFIIRVSLKHTEGGGQELTFSFKGKPGKGVFGAPKGLQILNE